MTDAETLRARAREMRAFLEERWQEWKAERPAMVNGEVATMLDDGKPLSHGMCRLTVRFLDETLPEAFPYLEWRATQGFAQALPGDPLIEGAPVPGGVRGADGEWRDHLWMETRIDGATWVVDLAADQFGHESVVVAPKDDRHRKNVLDEATDEHVWDATDSAERWAEMWTDAKAAPSP